MNILYLDCAMGAAGDMLMAALLELLPDRDAFLRDMNALGLPGIEVTAEPSVKCGVTGTHVHVFVHGEEEANKAKKAAEALFGGAGSTQDMPTVAAETGKKLLDVLTAGKVFASKSEGRRLIQQNGLSLNDAKVTDVDYILQESDFKDGEAIVKKGKKKYFKLVK